MCGDIVAIESWRQRCVKTKQRVPNDQRKERNIQQIAGFSKKQRFGYGESNEGDEHEIEGDGSRKLFSDQIVTNVRHQNYHPYL